MDDRTTLFLTLMSNAFRIFFDVIEASSLLAKYWIIIGILLLYNFNYNFIYLRLKCVPFHLQTIRKLNILNRLILLSFYFIYSEKLQYL